MSGVQLIKYDDARRALKACTTHDEAKHIVDKAVALKAYARQRHDPEMYRWVAEIELRARRRIGELTREIEKHERLRPKSGKQNKTQALEAAGISKSEAHRCEQIASVPEEQFESVMAEKQAASVSVTADDVVRFARRKVQERANAEIRAAAAPPAEGQYRCIVIDPPWPTQKFERDVRPNQTGELDYPTMTIDDIKKYELARYVVDDGSHLFCWTTQKHLPSAFEVLDAWGFSYVFTMVWHKAGGPQPFMLPQYNCEFVLYGRRGRVQFADTKNFFTCFEAPRREHSRKPDIFYDTVRRVCDGPRVDIFSREPREGFAQVGKEAEKFAAVA